MEKIQEIDTYILDNDNPAVCPKCGARTLFIDLENNVQYHLCPNTGCLHEFYGEFETEEERSQIY